MKIRILCGIACLLPLAELTVAAPQTGATFTASSNYLLHGVSRSSNDPALSAEVHTQSGSGLFGSLWTSTSRPRRADDTLVELGATLGFALAVDDNWSARLSYSHYESPWSRRPGFYQYDEFSADLRFRDRLFLAASYSPNTSRYAPVYGPVWNRSASTVEASLQQPLANRLRGNIGIGFYDLSALFGEGYWYGSVGLGWSWRRFSLDLAWVVPDTTARRLSYAGVAEKRLLGSASFAF